MGPQAQARQKKGAPLPGQFQWPFKYQATANHYPVLSSKYNCGISGLSLKLVDIYAVFFQPCDQGIIENLKVHYRRFLLRERISAIDEDREYKINLLHALQFLRRSWDAVKPETLSRCFRKAGFVINEQVGFLFLKK